MLYFIMKSFFQMLLFYRMLEIEKYATYKITQLIKFVSTSIITILYLKTKP